MEKDKPHILLCIWCQRRITREELVSGRHDHVDVEERQEDDLAVNTGIDCYVSSPFAAAPNSSRVALALRDSRPRGPGVSYLHRSLAPGPRHIPTTVPPSRYPHVAPRHAAPSILPAAAH